jgi:hypothetical protein
MPLPLNEDQPSQPNPNALTYERIQRETSHLQKRKSVRDGRDIKPTKTPWLWILLALGLLWLFFMDPVLHSFKRSDAIRDYLYLHNCGSDQKAAELAASGILRPNEVEILNRRVGSFQDYYANAAAASSAADSIIAYMTGVNNLHTGKVDQLDWLGKIRYWLFIRWGISPPTQLAIFEPSVIDS